MTVSEFADRCGFRIVAGADGASSVITGYYATDLLSDALGHAACGNVLVTVQSHANVIAVASQKKLSCVLFTKNILPEAGLCKLADREGIPLLVSMLSSFDTVCRIYDCCL